MSSQKPQQLQTLLNSFGLKLNVVELPGSTRTSVEAAQAVECELRQIAKSLVFKGKTSGKPYLIIASGPNRVSEAKIAALVGEDIEKPDADYVREQTGFAIGGIPPVGHSQKLRTFIDEELMALDEVWSAAGTPHALFKLTPQELVHISEAEIVDLKQ